MPAPIHRHLESSWLEFKMRQLMITGIVGKLWLYSGTQKCPTIISWAHHLVCIVAGRACVKRAPMERPLTNDDFLIRDWRLSVVRSQKKSESVVGCQCSWLTQPLSTSVAALCRFKHVTHFTLDDNDFPPTTAIAPGEKLILNTQQFHDFK